jgi:hypothetical protein
MKAHSTTDFTTKQRKHLAKTGAAMKGGRYPIRNAQDLANAKQAVGRTPPSGRPAVKAHIRERAKALGIGTAGLSKAGKGK